MHRRLGGERKMAHTLVKSPDYAAWLCEMKSRIRSAHLSAARAVNRDMILLYWDIGRGILENQEEQGWGKVNSGQTGRRLEKGVPPHKWFLGTQPLEHASAG